MGPPAQESQHSFGIRAVDGLAEDLCSDDHDGVGSQDEPTAHPPNHRGGLGRGHPLDVSQRRLSRKDLLVRGARKDIEGEARGTKQFGAAGRRRCEDTLWRWHVRDHIRARARRQCYRWSVVPVHDLLPAFLTDVLRKAPLCPEKVTFAWRHAVGPALDRATTVEFRDGLLVIRTRDEHWSREVAKALPMVRPRLDAILGAGTINAIKFAPQATPR